MTEFLKGLKTEDATAEDLIRQLMNLRDLQEEVYHTLEEHAILADETLDELEVREMDPDAPIVGQAVESYGDDDDDEDADDDDDDDDEDEDDAGDDDDDAAPPNRKIFGRYSDDTKKQIADFYKRAYGGDGDE